MERGISSSLWGIVYISYLQKYFAITTKWHLYKLTKTEIPNLIISFIQFEYSDVSLTQIIVHKEKKILYKKVINEDNTHMNLIIIKSCKENEL